MVDITQQSMLVAWPTHKQQQSEAANSANAKI